MSLNSVFDQDKVELETFAVSPGSQDDNSMSQDSKGAALASNDALRWFGILVPPALRHSQNDFKAASSNIPTLVNAMSQMKAAEIDIRRTRKKLSKLV